MGDNDEGIVNTLNKLNGIDNGVNQGDNDGTVAEEPEDKRRKKKTSNWISCVDCCDDSTPNSHNTDYYYGGDIPLDVTRNRCCVDDGCCCDGRGNGDDIDDCCEGCFDNCCD